MSREELEVKAFEIARNDMSNIAFSDEEIKEEMKSVSDEDLKAYIEEAHS